MINKFKIGDEVYIAERTSDSLRFIRKEIIEQSGEEFRAGVFWSWQVEFLTREEIKEKLQEFLNDK